jgi:O-antigen/teichoic acid export membrane protein
VFYSGFRSITLLFPQVLIAIGEARKNMHFSIIAALVLPLLFLLGSRWGTSGVAVGWIVGFPIVFLPFTMRYTLNRVGLGWGTYLKCLWPATSSSLVMAAVVLGIRLAIPASESPSGMLWRLIAMVAAGALTFCAMLFTVHRHRLTTFLAFVRAVRK